MAGGKIRLPWDRADAAVVNIYKASGTVSTDFTVAGSPVTFPYTLSGNTTFATTKGDTYSLSVTLNGVEIADEPDGAKRVDLIGAGSTELVIAPSPDDGFVSPTGDVGSPTADTAFLIATARPGPTDGSPFTIDLTWDDRYAQVSWIVDNEDGTFTFPDGAGDVAFGGIANVSINFTGASAISDAPGTLDSQVRVTVDGSAVVAVSSDFIDGDGQTVQSIGAFGPTFGGSRVDVNPDALLIAEAFWVNALDSDGSTAITDAAAAVTFAVSINRGVSAPTLP